MDNKRQYIKEIREIARKPPAKRNIYNFILDIGLIASSILASTALQSFWAYTFSIIIIGSRMRGIMNLLHESSHINLAPHDKRLNKLLGQACALPLLMTRETYTKNHIKHHLHFGDSKKDPDLIRYRSVFGGIAEKNPKQLDVWAGAILSFRNFLVYAYKDPIQEIVTSGWKHFLTIAIFWSGAVVSFALLGGLKLLLLYWVIPYLTSFKVICYVTELIEHFGIYGEPNDLDRSRNISANKLTEFLFWPHGDNYHLAHHLFPFVPGYRLAEVDAYLKRYCIDYAARRSI